MPTRVGKTFDSVYKIVPQLSPPVAFHGVPHTAGLTRTESTTSSIFGIQPMTNTSMLRLETQDLLVQNIVGSQDTVTAPSPMQSVTDFIQLQVFSSIPVLSGKEAGA